MSGKNPVPNEQAYEGVRALNPPNVKVSDVNPGSNQKRVQIGDIQVNESTNTAFMLTSAGASGQTWTALGSGTTGAVVTLTGGSGGAISPSAGNINLSGTANQITTAGSGSTITFSIPAAFIAPGSIASTTTITSGTALVATTTVTAGTGITSTTGNITATAGAVNAGTSMTATLGNITATNGNLVLSTAGNKLSIATGANASIGTSVAMTAGSVTISTTAVTASSKIFLTVNTPGGTQGTLSAPTASIVAATSFVINSSNAADTSTVNWLIIN
jgi:hypothetical protein